MPVALAAQARLQLEPAGRFVQLSFQKAAALRGWSGRSGHTRTAETDTGLESEGNERERERDAGERRERKERKKGTEVTT